MMYKQKGRQEEPGEATGATKGKSKIQIVTVQRNQLPEAFPKIAKGPTQPTVYRSSVGTRTNFRA